MNINVKIRSKIPAFVTAKQQKRFSLPHLNVGCKCLQPKVKRVLLTRLLGCVHREGVRCLAVNIPEPEFLNF
jgi:hypothetical protein